MRIFPLGENALTVEFGNVISPELNLTALAIAERFENDPFPGFIESVPAYSSTTFFYDVATVRQYFTGSVSAFDAVRHLVESALEGVTDAPFRGSRSVEIAVHFSDTFGPDLAAIGEFAGLSVDEVITLFTERTYRVYMLGFLPGFAYMGEVDERIAATRKTTPRLKVPKGSVGIAGRQTGIYPLESPGGWQIIGRTKMEMFTPDSDRPCALEPGDEVKFVRVE